MSKHLVFFAVYELSDLNRDEGVGSFQTLKKLTRYDGFYTFISKYSFRHHLFNTLREAFGWEPARVKVKKKGDKKKGDKKEGDKKVIQFDLSQEDILSSPELDAFGYMYTISEKNAITRKSPVALTKIVSFEPFLGDTAFYANHDLVRRALSAKGEDASPNPYGREEHMAFFRGGAVINANKLGVDEWIVSNEPQYKNGTLTVTLTQDSEKKIENLEEVPEENLPNWAEETLKIYMRTAREIKVFKTPEEHFIAYGKLGEKYYKVLFILNPQEKKKRIEDLINALKAGLSFQVGGEGWSLTPVFYVVALSKAPVQFFYPHIGLDFSQKPPKVVGLSYALNNPYLEDYSLFCNEDKLSLPEGTEKGTDFETLLRKLNPTENHEQG